MSIEMPHGMQIGIRIVAALMAAALFIGLDISAALAQSASCSRLYFTLQSLSRNSDFRSSDQTDNALRALQANERDAESAYIRSGCQEAQQRSAQLPLQCRTLARQILQQRDQVQRMSQSLANGNAVSQQREQVLQQIARFGCNQQGARPSYYGNTDRPRNFLDDLFGGGPDQGGYYGDNGGNYPGQEVEDPYADQQTGNGTIRTVCVRLSDGYYWPVSYSTVSDYIPQDAQTCEAQCPGHQVDLYFYNNPGQEPEQMINQEGQAYTALRTAFAYRKQFNAADSCKPQATTAEISVSYSDGGEERAAVTYGEDTIPLPIRDPRIAQPVTTGVPATYAATDAPLPKRRPSPTQTAGAPTDEPVVSVPNRLVKVGDKLVRVVGPDTPYAPPTLPANSG